MPMSTVQHIVSDVIQLFYPHHCRGCGSDILQKDQLLCIRCISELPHTRFAFFPGNDIERIFFGRIPVMAAHSECYFSKGQLIQRLIHLLKYSGMPEVGSYLGEIIGRTLLQSGRFSGIDYVIPLPLYPDKEFKRGYNQAAAIGEGVSNATNIPMLDKLVCRQRPTETQTKKHRTERWQNVRGSFVVTEPSVLAGKHILLVDDVITTGASIEACAQSILDCPQTNISIASIAHADK